MTTTFDTKTSWLATVTGDGADAQVFLRRPCGSAQVVICVGIDGYDYNKYHTRKGDRWGKNTVAYNIHFAANAGAQFSFSEWDEMNRAVTSAKMYLHGIWPS
jgi:hypothetical protein